MTLRVSFGNLAAAAALATAPTTNRLPYSDDLSNAVWTKNGGVSAALSGAVTAPDGSASVSLMTEGAVTDQPAALQVISGHVAGTIYTVSVYVRRSAGARNFALGFGSTAFGNNFGTCSVVFDGSTGAVLATNGAAIGRSYVHGAGWLRLIVTATASVAGSGAPQLRIVSGSSLSAYLGDGASGGYVWRMQEEIGPVATAGIYTAAAAASGGGWSATLPMTNVQVEGRARVARSVGVVGASVISGNLAAASAVGAAALYGHNASATARWTVEVYSGLNLTGSLLYSGEAAVAALGTVGPGLAAMWFPSVAGAASFRVTVSDPFNAAGYIQVGRLYLGDSIAPVYGAEYGFHVSWQDTSEQSRTQGGSLRTDVRAKFLRINIEFGLLNESERAYILSGLYSVGLKDELLASLYAGEGGLKERDYQILGKVTQAVDLAHLGIGAYGGSVTIDSV